MNLFFKIIVLLFPAILLGQGAEIKETPEEYLNHIVETWNVDSNKIVYISNETSMVDLAQNLHNSVLSFTKGELSTSAEILDGRREVDESVCGLALNNLNVENVEENLKDGKDYTKFHLKKLADNTDFNLTDSTTAILIYSKKMDYVIQDYFKVLEEFAGQGVDYIIITFDNEITSQIPEALNNG